MARVPALGLRRRSGACGRKAGAGGLLRRTRGCVSGRPRRGRRWMRAGGRAWRQASGAAAAGSEGRRGRARSWGHWTIHVGRWRSGRSAIRAEGAGADRLCQSVPGAQDRRATAAGQVRPWIRLRRGCGLALCRSAGCARRAGTAALRPGPLPRDCAGAPGGGARSRRCVLRLASSAFRQRLRAWLGRLSVTSPASGAAAPRPRTSRATTMRRRGGRPAPARPVRCPHPAHRRRPGARAGRRAQRRATPPRRR